MTDSDDRDKSLFEKEVTEDQIDINSPEEAIDPDIPKIELYDIKRGKLALVVGHTSKQQGARAVEPIDQFEYPWNKDLAQQIKLECGRRDITCGIFYRDGVGIKGAYAQVLSWGPSRCIELHFNSHTSPVEGTETLYGIEDVSASWATIVQQEMVNVYARVGKGDRGIKLRKKGQTGYTSLTQLKKIPSCLVEPFFGNSPEDSTLAASLVDNYVQSLVDAFQSSVPNEDVLLS